MSSRPRSTQADRKSGGARSTGKRSAKRLNRAQQQAMQVRAAETRFMPTTAPTDDEGQSATAAGTATATAPATGRTGAIATARAARTGSKRVVSRPVLISHEEEYRFITQDMIRLVITAAILLVLMLAVLFVVEQ